MNYGIVTEVGTLFPVTGQMRLLLLQQCQLTTNVFVSGNKLIQGKLSVPGITRISYGTVCT